MSVEEEIRCPTCDCSMDQASGTEYICTNGHRMIKEVVGVRARAQMGLGEIVTSGKEIDGLPVYQEEGGYTPSGASGRTIIQRDAKGARVIQEASGRHYENKTDQELATGEAFIREYNRINGTHFSTPHKHEKDELIDLISRDEDTERTLQIQVTVADPRPWKKLHTVGRYNNEEEEQGAFDKLWRRIEEKKERYPREQDRRDLILLLDGWPPLPPSSLKKFITEYSSCLLDVGFLEIWYVARPPPGTVTRLYPTETGEEHPRIG